jgi:hypothetical protein
MTRPTTGPRQLALNARFPERQPPPPKRILDLPKPPRGNRPVWLASAWALPKRDEGGLALFPDEYAAAERFWAWLAGCYEQTAARCRRGYAYLTSAERPDEESFALYEALTRWLDWGETAYWLLLRWYGPENPCPRLRLPLPDLHDGDGHRLTVVRELRGVPGEVLLEDALWHWRAQLILSHRLTDVGEAPPPDPEPPQETADAG